MIFFKKMDPAIVYEHEDCIRIIICNDDVRVGINQLQRREIWKRICEYFAECGFGRVVEEVPGGKYLNEDLEPYYDNFLFPSIGNEIEMYYKLPESKCKGDFRKFVSNCLLAIGDELRNKYHVDIKIWIERHTRNPTLTDRQRQVNLVMHPRFHGTEGGRDIREVYFEDVKKGYYDDLRDPSTK